MSLSQPPVKPERGRPANIRLPGSRSRWSYLVALCPPPLALALLILGLAWGLALLRGPLTIDIGANDQLDLLYLKPVEDGFFAAETRPLNPDFPQADLTYRWAGANTRLKIPWPLDAVPLKAILRATAPRPDRLPFQTGASLKLKGKLEWDTLDLGQAEVNGFYQGNYYQFSLPVHLRPNLSNLVLEFEADNAFRPAKGDTRELSILFFSLRLEPNYSEFGWRGWVASFARPGLLAVIAFCCWGIGRSFWRRGSWALGLEAVAGGLLLLSMVIWPQAAEPLYAPWAFIMPLVWSLMALAEMFRRRATGLPAPFVYAATLFPVLPLAQFAFGRLDLYSVNPGSVLIGAYVGALFYAGGIYISSKLTHPGLFERAFERGMLIAALVSFAYNHFTIFQLNLHRGTDFKYYYLGLLNHEQGGLLYDLPTQAASLPPTFSITLWPLARLFGPDTTGALFVWRIVSELLLVPCLLILGRVFGGERHGVRMTPAVWFLALNWGQISESLGYGQWNIFGLLGLSLMALWLKKGRAGVAGVALALPVGLWFYPLLAAFSFATESERAKRWRAWGGLLLGLTGLLALTGITVGFDQIGRYISRVAFENPRPPLDITNQSLWGFWSRLSVAQVTGDFKGDLPGWVAWAGYSSALGLTLLTGWIVWRRRGPNSDQLLRVGTLIWLSVLIPPFAWMSYMVLCLIGVLILAQALNRPSEGNQPRWQLFGFGLAYAVLAYGGRYDFFGDEEVGLARLGSSYRFLAVLALFGLSLWQLWKSQPVPTQVDPPE